MSLHTPAYQALTAALACVRRRTDFVPSVGVVLGSGLGSLAEHIRVEAEVAYADIDGFPIPTVEGHTGRFVFGYIGTIPVVFMQGRLHGYEGLSPAETVMPVRLMGLLGAKTVLLTCMAGAVNPKFDVGDLMVIRGQIAAFVPSPLCGDNLDELGPRFPDMSRLYDHDLRRLLLNAGNDLGLPMREGVYVQMRGPQYESSAEVRMLHMLGADAVGMSTAAEAIAARHMGLRVCGIAFLSNMAAGLSELHLAHEDVLRAGSNAEPLFAALLRESILRMGVEA